MISACDINYVQFTSIVMIYCFCVETICKISLCIFARFHERVKLDDHDNPSTAHTHILVSELTTIIWTSAGILLIRNLGIKLREILLEMHTFSFNKCIGKYGLENGGHFVSASIC